MKQLPKIPKQSCYYIDLKKTDNAHAYIPQKNYFVKKKKQLLRTFGFSNPSTSFRIDRRGKTGSGKGTGMRPFGISQKTKTKKKNL